MMCVLLLCIDLVSCLLDSGANVNDCGGIHCGGVSPLMDAASNGHMDIVQLLVQRGADIFHKDIKVHTVHVHVHWNIEPTGLFCLCV